MWKELGSPDLSAFAIARSTGANMAIGPTVLVCEPEFFDVSYIINDWMHPDEWHSHQAELLPKAKAGWQIMVEKFQEIGFEIEHVKPAPGVPDLVFTANAAIVLNGKALLAHFKCPERVLEEPHNAKAFDRMLREGKLEKLATFSEGIIQEGAGDCAFDPSRKIFFAGYGQRSNKDSIPEIEKFFDIPVVPLELVTTEFYHVDISVCPLSMGDVLYYPGAFSQESRDRLKNVVGDRLIAVDEGDAKSFVLNAVNLDDKIVMAECSPSLETTLNNLGYQVVKVPMITPFRLAGGSAWCLSLRLDNRTQ